MGDIGMIKGGACLVALASRVVVDVVDHRAASISGSTGEKRAKKQ